MAETDRGEAPRREVSWGGRFLGVGIMGVPVIVVISAENAGNADVTSNAALILGLALAAAIAVPMTLFRRTIRD